MATRPVVPRANGEGSIGTAAKHWGNGYFDELNTDLIVPQYGSTNNSVGASDRKWKEGYFEKLIVKNGIDPDAFSGNTDAEKLQSAINYAVTQKTSTITISRKYDITGSSLNINKRMSNADDGLRQKLTFLGVGTGEIYKGDSGYIFTGSVPQTERYTFTAGDVSCINMKFRGSVSVQNDKSNLCSVFDCHRIIRINCFGCSYSSVGKVFDGSESISGASNMQSIRTFGDTVTNCFAYFSVKNLYDCVIDGALIEDCTYGIYGEHDNTNGVRVFGLHIINCCIESCDMGAIVFEEEAGYENKYNMSDLQIENCYFEKCGAKNVTLHYTYSYNIAIVGNHFSANAEDTNKHYYDLYMTNAYWTLDGNSANGDNTYTLFYLSKLDGSFYISAKTTFLNWTVALTNMPNIIQDANAGALPVFIDAITDAKNVSKTGIYRISANQPVSDLPAPETEGTLYVFKYDAQNICQIFVGARTWIMSRNNNAWSDWSPTNVGSVSTTISMNPVDTGVATLEKVGRVCSIKFSGINNLPAGWSTITNTIPQEYRPKSEYKAMIKNEQILIEIGTNGVIKLYNYGSAITTGTSVYQTFVYSTI